MPSPGTGPTATPPELGGLTVVTATGLEARAARRALRGTVPVVRVGIGGALSAADRALISCGISGSLRPDIDTGAVHVPERVLRPDGTWLLCDPELTAALAAATRRLGLTPVTEPLLTSPVLITGPAERQRWADRACAGVDMETGLLSAQRVAAVRVVLDSPVHELAPEWRHPLRALVRPACWPQLPWLAREGPRCARLAAAVLAEAVSPAERR